MKQHLRYIGLDVHKERNEVVLLPASFWLAASRAWGKLDERA